MITNEDIEKVLEQIATLRNNLESDAIKYPSLTQVREAEAAGLNRAFEIVRIELLNKE